MHVASRVTTVTMQDYDEALKLSPEHILSKMRKGMVLQLLKRPEVIRPSSCIVVGVLAPTNPSDADAGIVADAACKGSSIVVQRPQNTFEKY